MKVIFNDQYEYPIKLARESYDGINGDRSFNITLQYEQNLTEELENFFHSTKINNFKIINSKDEIIYFTDKLIVLNQIYIMLSDERNTGINLEFIKRVDDIT